ncbi:hypothetical protein Zmor_007376 [Zophobas morio]|uniref:Reverse transcriptase domain-containing protein n=1 Tax=Zophobas morio TaxID=2755281 RepID=A0AA38MPD7_9CUCU|nr:hypothetical protein Zmor_007376 [Zophobas morio]
MQYQNSRKKLKNKILHAKKQKWKELCDDLDNDVWGDAYKIICGKMRIFPKIQLDDESKYNIAKKPFPNKPTQQWKYPELILNESEDFKKEELHEPSDRLKSNKAPGSDQIPAEVIKAVIKNSDEKCLILMNNLLREGTFPRQWKTAHLVLVEKPKKNADQPITYRPLCILNTMGKLLEQLLCRRLTKDIEKEGNLADFQYEFRKGYSTVHAMDRVKQIAVDANRGAYRHREFCALITLVIKNAFNSAPWEGIIESTKKWNVTPALQRMIMSYLEDQTIIIGEKTMAMTCGEPQGSVIGPLLWNIYYDQVLRVDMPEEFTLVEYADDLAIVVCAKTAEKLE